MWPKNSMLKSLWITGALLPVLLLLAACGVEVVDQTPAASTLDLFTSPLTVGSERHNLAVMAVEFDPPLSYQQLIVRRQSVALLVVVENTGTMTERDVMVRAQLTSPESSGFSLTQGASVASIAPGEVQIVRFARLGDIPYYRSYLLEVAVEPVADEVDISDNRKAFDIQIQQK
jgi:hypothetical protein